MPVTQMASYLKIKIPDTALDMCQKAAKAAIEVLQNAANVISPDNASISDDDLALLKKYYFIDVDDADIGDRGAAIRQLLKATKKGIKSNDITVDYGYFNKASRMTTTHIMYLGRDNFTRPNRLVRYFIHEASHMYANTDDMAGYIGLNGNYQRSGLVKDTVANNADSLAVFAVLLSEIPLE